MRDALLTSWEATWRDLNLVAPMSVGADLLAAYDDFSVRAYHTGQHLGEVLAIVHDRCSAHGRAVTCLVELALWFHDAVYDPRASDNESRSAAWAVRVLTAGEMPFEQVQLVEEAVLATAGHDTSELSIVSQLVADADLSIFAASPARFDQYEAQVREEYRHIPERTFRLARAKILRAFSRRDRIYVTPAFAHLEPVARANLAQSIASLVAPLPGAVTAAD